MSPLNLPTVAEVNAVRRACPKGMPHQLVKEAKAEKKKDLAKTFRDAVWDRDEGKSRATGQPLVKSGTVDWKKLGEVDHSIPRSLAPERIYDVANGILLSKWENRMRKISCRDQPEYRVFDYTGPDDRRKPQHFIWRDQETGRITKETRG